MSYSVKPQALWDSAFFLSLPFLLLFPSVVTLLSSGLLDDSNSLCSVHTSGGVPWQCRCSYVQDLLPGAARRCPHCPCSVTLLSMTFGVFIVWSLLIPLAWCLVTFLSSTPNSSHIGKLVPKNVLYSCFWDRGTHCSSGLKGFRLLPFRCHSLRPIYWASTVYQALCLEVPHSRKPTVIFQSIRRFSSVLSESSSYVYSGDPTFHIICHGPAFVCFNGS